ncbi:MAG: hypothetical protein QOG63_207 [Thermoleophilaceae bacterium]|nr:hypothetical protein [Thermoleophilaceae bacterium]
MTADELRAARMRAQRLDGRARDVAQLVRELGGVQAQEPNAAALSIRARTEGLTAADVERALVDERSIVRTWAMRGTIHLVAAEDAGWMHSLLAPLAMPGEQRALDVLEVPVEHRARAVETIVAALGAHGPLTRAELNEHLGRAGIDTSGQRAAHLPRLAALEGHVCFGPRRAGKDTYALTADWLGPRAAPLPHDRALRELAQRYLGAYGPAEPRDFATWSGLPMRDAKAAWEGLEPPPVKRAPEPPDPPLVRLLPGFDTYLLGYRDRTLAVPAEHARAVWPGGGIIRPTVVANGRAVATWRLERRGKRVDVTVDPFGEEVDAAAEITDVQRFLAR